LNRPVDRIPGVEHLAQDIQAAQERAREAAGIGFQAAGVHASLGNDHVVGVSIDESDGAVIFTLIECGRGVESEVPDLLPPAEARRGHRDATDLRRQRAFLPAFRVEIDLVSGPDQAPAEVNDVGLGSASRGVDAWEVQGQPHGSALPERSRRFSTASLSYSYSHLNQPELEAFRIRIDASTASIPRIGTPGLSGPAAIMLQ